MHKIFLKKGKEEPLKRFHPWIFSGAIDKIVKAHNRQLVDGDLAEVLDFKGQHLATGYYNDGSIAVRVLSFDISELINDAFWTKRLQNAWNYRQTLGLVDSDDTNCYRLIHAEGDGLPGLIIDVYAQTVVVQCHAIGMHRQLGSIKKALLQVFDNPLLTIYDKSVETLPPQYVSQIGLKNDYLHATTLPEGAQIVLENGHQFTIDWITGQKTGFFLDQRDNRQLITRYSKGKKVLNTFCYSGGFSVYALKAGAESVHSIDVSQKAINLTDKNVALNQPFEGTAVSTAADVLSFLKDNKDVYDVMVVDPPAFAKSISKRHNAVQAYKRLNTMALRQITEGGILFTFSCSQVVDRQLFYDTIVAAAIEAGRKVRVMHQLTQPADHPVNIFHPEGSYLKGLVLQVL